jgi:hypothetical protein
MFPVVGICHQAVLREGPAGQRQVSMHRFEGAATFGMPTALTLSEATFGNK